MGRRLIRRHQNTVRAGAHCPLESFRAARMAGTHASLPGLGRTRLCSLPGSTFAIDDDNTGALCNVRDGASQCQESNGTYNYTHTTRDNLSRCPSGTECEWRPFPHVGRGPGATSGLCRNSRPMRRKVKHGSQIPLNSFSGTESGPCYLPKYSPPKTFRPQICIKCQRPAKV